MPRPTLIISRLTGFVSVHQAVELEGLEPSAVNTSPGITVGPPDHPIIAIEAKTATPNYRQALANALRAVAAAGEALVTLAAVLERPQGTLGPPTDPQAQQVPTISTNGHRGLC